MVNKQQFSIHTSSDNRFNSIQLGSASDVDGISYYTQSASQAPSLPNPQSASAKFERFSKTAPGIAADPSSYGHYHTLPGPLASHATYPVNGTLGTNLGALPDLYLPNSGNNPGFTGAMDCSFGAVGSSKTHAFSSDSAAGAAGVAPGLFCGRIPAGGMASAGPTSGILSQWSIDPSISPRNGGSVALASSLSPHSPLVPPTGGYYGTTGPKLHPALQSVGGIHAQQGDPQSNTEPATFPSDDDVIPTAIVVKNIPFSVKREQLLQIIEDLAIPVPYAFNYHFDQGVFRGLAFANFRSSEEADTVVAALNGFDVSGRKLRVEYKKVLQTGEKQRIEKEKALKRMRSMQLEKERIRRDGDGGVVGHGSAALLVPNASSTASSPAVPAVGADTYGSGSKASNLTGHHDVASEDPARSDRLSPSILRPTLTADALRSVPSALILQAPEPASEGSGTAKKEELDLNNPQTLEIYSRVLLFKDDRMRDELAFSRNLSPQERRTVHLVAQKLNLYHYSTGEGAERLVIVTKHEVRSHPDGRSLRSQASTIGRSQRSDGTNAFLSPLTTSGPGGTAPSRMAGSLRGKKSAPDMKRMREYHESTGVGSAGSAGGNNGINSGRETQQHSALSTLSLGRKSNGNMIKDFDYSSHRPGTGEISHSDQNGGGGIGGAAGLQSLFSSPFEVPPVPSLGSSSYAGHINSLRAECHALQPGHLCCGNGTLRQPRAPPTPGQSTESRNFAPRSRVPTSGSQVGAVGLGHNIVNDGIANVDAAQQQASQARGDIRAVIDEVGKGGLDARSQQPLEL